MLTSPVARVIQPKSCRTQKSSAKLHCAELALLLPIAFLLASCSSISSSQPNSAGSDPMGIQVTPAQAEVKSSASLQFTAAVSGTAFTGVVWKTNIGTISSTGLFKAPSVTVVTTATITATSTPVPAPAISLPESSPFHPTGIPAVLTGSTTLSILPAVSQASQLRITSISLPPGTIGMPYDAVITASGGSGTYQWTSTSGALPAGLALSSTTGAISGVPTQSGNYSLQVQVTDSLSHKAEWNSTLAVSAQTSGNYDGPAELPRVYLQTAMSNTPAPGTTITVNAGGDFQSALNSASCGDTIQLQAGATFSGLFKLPAKSCDDQHWIIIRTSSPDTSLPAEGSRVTPCYAGVASLPGRPPFNCVSTQNVLAKILYNQVAGSGPIQFEPGANYYRFIGLEITRLAGTGYVGSLVMTQVGATADQLIFDRSWLHGTAQDETTTGVALGGMTNTAVINSFLTDFHCTSKVGSCTDAHAVAGGSDSYPGGPYQIANNFLEASGENILFGGGAATATPADIQISQNHFFKPLIWMSGQSGYVGGTGGNPFIVKNHLELKNAQRVLAEDNIFEYSWGGFSQTGFSILLTPKDQYVLGSNTNVCPLCQVTDVTIRYSTISHVGAGIQICDILSDGGGSALAGERYSIHDVVIDDISRSKYVGSGGFIEYGNLWSANVLNSVTINHVTAFPDPAAHILSLYNLTTYPTMWGFTFTNNIVNATTYPVWNGVGNTLSCAYSDVPITSLSACFSSYSFTNNVIANSPSAYPASKWPKGNFFPSDDSAIQFVNYNNGDGGDYALLSSSPYKNAGSDGKDPGADISAVTAAINGVY